MSFYILEALEELVPGVDLSKLSTDERDELEEDMEHHIRMCLEVESYTYPSSADLRQSRENEEIRKLKAEVKRLEEIEDIYRTDIQRNFGGKNVFANTYTGKVVIED